MFPVTYANALTWLLRPDVEGGEVNHPNDRGGHTKYGIADAADGKKDGMADLDRDGRPDKAISDLTPADTAPFYHAHYWAPAGCEQIAGLSPALAIALFDGAVHHSPARSVSLLQQVLGAKVDGQFGPRTLALLKGALSQQGERPLLLGLLERRAAFMLGIVQRDPSQWVYAAGWLKRLLRLQNYLAGEVMA